jgi:hypothetical protein
LAIQSTLKSRLKGGWVLDKDISRKRASDSAQGLIRVKRKMPDELLGARHGRLK